MEEIKKCECGMILDESTRCQCEPDKCFYCCTCPKECVCGCRKKVESELKGE